MTRTGQDARLAQVWIVLDTSLGIDSVWSDGVIAKAFGRSVAYRQDMMLESDTERLVVYRNRRGHSVRIERAPVLTEASFPPARGSR